MQLCAAHYCSYLMNDELNPHLGESDPYLVVPIVYLVYKTERLRYTFGEICLQVRSENMLNDCSSTYL